MKKIAILSILALVLFVGTFFVSSKKVDAATPVISALSVTPNSGTVKIGDTITLNITADFAGYIATNITVNGVDITGSNFQDLGGGSYSADYVVSDGDSDVASGAITASVTLFDGVNPPNAAFTNVDANTLVVDANAPTISRVTFKTQGGAFPNSDSTLWYNYSGDTFEAYVEGSENLDEVRVCIMSLTGANPVQTCDATAFTNPANYITSGTGIGATSYTFTGGSDLETIAGQALTSMVGYSMNVMIIDDAGNIYISPNASDAFAMVWEVNPLNLPGSGLGGSTTDWSTISDFTDVSGLTFEESTGLGKLEFTANVDLTDSATLTALQNFATNVQVGGGDGDGSAVIGINSAALAALNVAADLTITVPGADQPGIVVYTDAGAIDGYVDVDGNDLASNPPSDTISSITWGAGTLTFSTTGFSYFGTDNTAPTVSNYSPTDGNTSASTTANLSLTFNENVRVGTGNIIIYKESDDSIVETIDITGGLVTFNGTTGVSINPTANLLSATAYYIQIDAGAILDTVGNQYAGIADETTWNFTTTSGGGSSYSPSPAPTPNPEPTPNPNPTPTPEPVLIAPGESAPQNQFRAQVMAQLSNEEKNRRQELMRGTYQWQYITQSPYPSNLQPGEEVDVWVEVKNIGTATWFNNGENVVRLGSGSSYGNQNQQRDYNSEFANSNWYSANRPANILHPEVQPGWHTRFEFKIKAPSTAGVYKAYFTPVIDGMQWMNDIGLYWQITVE